MAAFRNDLDRIQQERTDNFWKKLKSSRSWKHSDIFLSERVLETLAGEKILLAHYNLQEILSLVPFSPVQYVEICSNCISSTEFSNFKSLVTSGAVIPVFVQPYEAYPSPLSEFVSAHDHISSYEYSGFRTLKLGSMFEGMLCSHC